MECSLSVAFTSTITFRSTRIILREPLCFCASVLEPKHGRFLSSPIALFASTQEPSYLAGVSELFQTLDARF